MKTKCYILTGTVSVDFDVEMLGKLSTVEKKRLKEDVAKSVYSFFKRKDKAELSFVLSPTIRTKHEVL